MTLEEIRKRLSTEISGHLKANHFSGGGSRGIVEAWASEFKREVFKNVSSLIGVSFSWGEIEFKDGAAKNVIIALASKEIEEVFESFKPEIHQLVQKNLSKIKKQASKAALEEIESALDDLVRAYVREQVMKEISIEAHAVTGAWFEKAIANIEAGEQDEGS